MALRNAFGELALEVTQVASESHLAAMHDHLTVEDGHMSTLHSDLTALLAEVQSQQKNALTNAELRAAAILVDPQLSKKLISTQLEGTDNAVIMQGVIHGRSTAGGGTYVDVKVNPSGALAVDTTGSSVVVSNFPETQNVSGNVTVSGSVSVSNLPAEYPLPSAQVSTLTPQKDALTNAQLRAADVNVADSGEREYLHYATDITNIGDNTVLTPAAGKRIRIRWIYAINDPTASTPCKIRIRFGTKPDIYNVWALSKRQVVTGAVNEPLIVNLSATANIAFTVIYEEI